MVPTQLKMQLKSADLFMLCQPYSNNGYKKFVSSFKNNVSSFFAVMLGI
jgi:hypothetical protein